MMRRIGMLSGGEASWAACKLDAQRRGVEGLTLLFCDTKSEDADTYRFLADSVANIGAPLVTIADGRDLWQLFRDERMLGNTRADVCSRVLKREMADRWCKDNCDPADTVRLVGIHVEERERFVRLRDRLGKQGWKVEAPLCEKPYMSRGEISRFARAEGLAEQRLYRLGMPHANCAGLCIKAGVGHFAHALRVIPDTYAEWERGEESMRQHLGKDVAILRDRRGGQTLPMTLKVLRERIEAGGQCELFGPTGCGCFAGEAEE